MNTTSIITGFADEVSDDLDVQIRAIQELGWKHIDLRTVDGKNVSSLSDDEFERAYHRLQENDIAIACFGSTVANWGREVNSDLAQDLEELRTSIRHMQSAGVRYLRIMSYKVAEPAPLGGEMESAIINGIKQIVEMAEDGGVVCLHENCLTWGGQSYLHSLRLLDAVDSPALRLVFDTGNPVSMKDVRGSDPYDYQDAYLFFEQVKEYVDYIHIKDAVVDSDGVRYVFPGQGDGRVREILKSVSETRPGLPISIEPHVSVVFHDPSIQASFEDRWNNFVEYGRQVVSMAKEAGITFSL
ncbi:MAG: sugar phosphate isomerase/epimerase family protein [Desulfocapsaceae bacterium]